jgi:hypothetical protein
MEAGRERERKARELRWGVAIPTPPALGYTNSQTPAGWPVIPGEPGTDKPSKKGSPLRLKNVDGNGQAARGNRRRCGCRKDAPMAQACYRMEVKLVEDQGLTKCAAHVT